MTWNTRIREAFESAGRQVDDAVLDELADHAADLEAEVRQSGGDSAAVAREVSGQIARWVQERPARQQRRHASDPEPSSTKASLFVSLVRDLRYAFRVLSRQPGPFAAGATTIALGIGAVTVMFALVWGVLLQPLPWPEPDRLVRVYESRRGGNCSFGQFGAIVTNAAYLAWQDAPTTIDGISAWNSGEATLTGVGKAERVRSASVTPGLFGVLGVGPVLGRAFRDDDAPAGAARVVLISHAFWQQRLGRRTEVIGQSLRLDGEPFTIVGVMGAAFAFPDRETSLWLPLHVPSAGIDGAGQRNIRMFRAIARLRPGVTVEQAAGEASARAQATPQESAPSMAIFGSTGPAVMTLVPALEDATREVRPALLVLLAAVALLLTAAAGNVANVQLARAAARRRELAIRCALGANRAQLARLLIVESAVVGVIGGLGGLALAKGLIQALPALLPADFPRVDQVHMDWRSVLAAMAAALGAGLTAGVLPAWHARRIDTCEVLTDDGRAPTGLNLRLGAARARAAVMAAQVAIATVLLIGAALLSQSFIALLRADRGFQTARVLSAELPITGDRSRTRQNAILDEMVERVGAVPGVVAAGYTSILPLTGSESVRAFEMPGRLGEGRVAVRAGFRVVSAGYLKALGMRVVEGRGFQDRDTATSQTVAVVNRAFADTYLDRTPIGEIVPVGTEERPDWQVVGVVEDVRAADGTRTGPEVFVVARQWPDVDGGYPVIAARTVGPSTELAPVLRGIVADIDPTLALGKVATLEDRVVELLAKPRLYSVLLGGFAVTALAIAGVGLFGVLSFSIAQRSPELAVRSALGASPASLVRLVLRQGLTVTMAGLLAGIALSLLMVESLGQWLYGVSGRDPATYVAVALFLLATSAVACIAPALRAARLDPVVVLKSG